jgi:hypothetical protein
LGNLLRQALAHNAEVRGNVTASTFPMPPCAFRVCCESATRAMPDRRYEAPGGRCGPRPCTGPRGGARRAEGGVAEFSVHGDPPSPLITVRRPQKPRLIDTGSHPRRGVYFCLAGRERPINPAPDPRAREDDSRPCGWLREHQSEAFSGGRVIRPEPARSVLRLSRSCGFPETPRNQLGISSGKPPLEGSLESRHDGR